MRWLLVVGLVALTGCGQGDSADTAVVAPTTQSTLPLVVVDSRHAMGTNGNVVPYIVAAGEGFVLDATQFNLQDPKRLVRLPNAVHVVHDKSLYTAPWPETGVQMASVEKQTLKVVFGEPFTGFAPGKQAYVAIGLEGPDYDKDKLDFTPFWSGLVLFR